MVFRWLLSWAIVLAVLAVDTEAQSCNISQIEGSFYATTSYRYSGQFYALVITFSGPVSFSLAETSSSFDIAWPRVRSRMRITTSRRPDYDLLVAREQLYNDLGGTRANQYVIQGNTLRVVVGAVLEEGETVTLRYWRPPITPFVDLLAGGQSVLDFNCTATMPNVTRLVGQVTLFDYVALPSLSPTPPPMVIQVRSS